MDSLFNVKLNSGEMLHFGNIDRLVNHKAYTGRKMMNISFYMFDNHLELVFTMKKKGRLFDDEYEDFLSGLNLKYRLAQPGDTFWVLKLVDDDPLRQSLICKGLMDDELDSEYRQQLIRAVYSEKDELRNFFGSYESDDESDNETYSCESDEQNSDSSCEKYEHMAEVPSYTPPQHTLRAKLHPIREYGWFVTVPTNYVVTMDDDYDFIAHSIYNHETMEERPMTKIEADKAQSLGMIVIQ